MFSLICTWINDWVNNREAGDLRCHWAHYSVTVMSISIIISSSNSSSSSIHTRRKWKPNTSSAPAHWVKPPSIFSLSCSSSPYWPHVVVVAASGQCSGQWPAQCDSSNNNCRDYLARWNYIQGLGLVQFTITATQSRNKWVAIAFSQDRSMVREKWHGNTMKPITTT